MKIKPWPELWKYLYLKLIVKKFQRLRDVQPDLDYRALSDLPGCKSYSWRRFTLKCLCWCVEGEMVEFIQPEGSNWWLSWGLLCGTSGMTKLCMMHCHICHIYGIWRSKEVKECFKIIIWGGNASHKEGGGAN